LIGEGSVYASTAVGRAMNFTPFDPTGKITVAYSTGVTFVMFPHSGFGNGFIPSNRDINNHAAGAFVNFGSCRLLAFDLARV
jgi:hypothetical protein